eukprot:m.131416 g.131416  ORF g.131416 m.131416 type:complete len:142 (-) comp17476_c0_seq4:756-1181(-)
MFQVVTRVQCATHTLGCTEDKCMTASICATCLRHVCRLQLLHHTATSSFLLQAYFSTIILYAGIYTLLHRYQPDSWRGTDSEGVLGGKNDSYVVRSFVIFVYYSIATMTSTGYGDVHPESWYRVSAGGWNAPEDCAACARM